LVTVLLSLTSRIKYVI